MRVERNNGSPYFLRIGWVEYRGLQRFDLGRDRLAAFKRAGKIHRLWLTQGQYWTPAGLKKARQIASGLG